MFLLYAQYMQIQSSFQKLDYMQDWIFRLDEGKGGTAQMDNTAFFSGAPNGARLAVPKKENLLQSLGMNVWT